MARGEFRELLIPGSLKSSIIIKASSKIFCKNMLLLTFIAEKEYQLIRNFKISKNADIIINTRGAFKNLLI